jgi:hypothetical protein
MSETPHPLTLIRSHGDLLERHVFSVDAFANEFSVYPHVWARYVLPNRVPGKFTLTNPDWIRFAERHYSAVIRCWNARCALEKIRKICTESVDRNEACDYLELHEFLIAFFCGAGSAIDNLKYAFAAYPIKCLGAFEKKMRRPGAAINLAWIYDRRTQYVHKAIVPCFGAFGLASFDASFFTDTETKWDQTLPLKVESVADLVDLIWSHFVDEMRSCWCELFDLLKANVEDTGAPLTIQPVEPLTLQWSSGTPQTPHGWPNLPHSGYRQQTDLAQGGPD